MEDNTRKTELARRAVAAAESHGLDIERLECCARGYGVETGPWMGELLALARAAWGLPVQVNPPLSGVRWLVYVIVGEGEERHHACFGRSTEEGEALVQCLEAAPAERPWVDEDLEQHRDAQQGRLVEMLGPEAFADLQGRPVTRTLTPAEFEAQGLPRDHTIVRLPGDGLVYDSDTGKLGVPVTASEPEGSS